MISRLLLLVLFLMLGPFVAAREEDVDKKGSVDSEETVEPISVEIAVFEYPPLYHTSVSGNFSGVIGETVKEICRESLLDCKFRMRPVSRAYLELENNIAQALITVKFDRFKNCCIESDWNYPWRSGLFSKQPVKEIPTNLAELTGKSLILVQGWQSPYSYFQTLAEAENDRLLTIYRANSSSASLQMLKKNRAHYLWGGEEFFWYMQKLDMKNVNFLPLLEIPMVLWFSKQEEEISKRFNAGFRRLLSKGLLDEKNSLIKGLMIERYEDPLLTN